MIKAAFFDIDGTLLSFKTHKVSVGTVRAFEVLRKHGVQTFLSTGRPMVLVPEMPLNFEAYITMNGGLVFTPEKVLLSHPIDGEDLKAWLDYAKEHRTCTMIFTRDGMFASQLNETGMKVREQLEFKMPEVVDIEELYGVEAYQIIALTDATKDKEVGELMQHCRLPRWHPAFTDIVAAGISKASGMEAICKHFGIEREETLAFGDGANDMEMLRWAGIGVAMGNAAEEVKQAADISTRSVDEEGIEYAVNQLFG